MPINEQYLNSLGISDLKSRKGLISAYNALFKREEDINTELAEVLAISEIAQQKEAEIARSLGLELQKNQATSWNNYFKRYEMTAQLEDKNSPTQRHNGQTYFTYDGREIKTSIHLSASNTNFNPDHINAIFEDAYTAAHALMTDKRYLKAIARVHAEFAKDIKKIMHDFDDGNKRGISDIVIDITDRTRKANNLFVNRLAIELARAQKNEPAYIPKEIQELKTFVDKIRDKEKELNANKRRPIIVKIYPSGPNEWLMITNTPNSDEPSTRRTLERGMFSNDFSGEIELITKMPNGEFQRSKVRAGKDRRSSSIAILKHIKDKQEFEQEFQKIYPVFKNLIVQYARDELVASLNAGKSIPSEIVTKEAYITLLSPIVGHINRDGLPDVLTIENEYSQLKFTERCLEEISRETLNFTDPQDLNYIATHAKIAPSDIQRLQTIQIKHRSYFRNYMVNKYLGVHLEKFDRPTVSVRTEKKMLEYKESKNYRYFKRGNCNCKEDIIAFIKRDRYVSATVQRELIAILSRAPLVNVTDRRALENLIENNSVMGNLRDLLEVYLDIEKFHHKDPTGISQTRLAAGYIMATEEAVLADILGYTPHHTCKSGIDRTGLLALIKEARLPAELDPNAEAEFIERLLAALQHGNSREIKHINDPNAQGLQIPATVLKGYVSDVDSAKMEKFMTNQNFEQLGKIKKHIYKVTDPGLKAAIASVQQADELFAITSSLDQKHKPVVFTPTMPTGQNNNEIQKILAALKNINPENPRFPPTKPQ